jgi:hypothetical protein
LFVHYELIVGIPLSYRIINYVFLKSDSPSRITGRIPYGMNIEQG